MSRRRLTREESQGQTRAHPLEAAAQVFARRGYYGASVAEIAQEAGYSHGAVYSNFKGKEDLFLALYEDWVARRVAEIEGGPARAATLAERARAGVDLMMHGLARDPYPFVLRLEFAACAARDRDLRRKLGSRARAIPLAIQRLIQGAADEEMLELSLSAEEVALALQALSLGLALETLLLDGVGDPEVVRPGLGGDLAALVIEKVTAVRGTA